MFSNQVSGIRSLPDPESSIGALNFEIAKGSVVIIARLYEVRQMQNYQRRMRAEYYGITKPFHDYPKRPYE